MDGDTDRWTDGQTGGPSYKLNHHHHGQLHTGGWTGGQTDRWADGQAGGRTDRRSDQPSYSDEWTHWTSQDGRLDLSLMDQYLATMLKFTVFGVFFLG